MRRLVALGSLVALTACVGPRPPLPLLADVDHARAATVEERSLAPQAFAEADGISAQAHADYAAGRDIAASLEGERAIAAYQRARMVARTARATTALARAQSQLAGKADELHSLEAARKAAERDGEELSKRLAIARELRAPAPIGKADGKREAARQKAARALATQARLLCGAARLLGAPAHDLDDAAKKLDEVDKRLEQPRKAAPIDTAAALRTTCLSALTAARHAARSSASAATTATDVLLSELSAAGLAPARDERGVVVTLHDAFHGRALTPAAETRLESLGRVAAAHADLAVQVVVHDASPQPAAAGEARAKAAAAALIKGGAKSDRVATFDAGTRAPIVDPNDAKVRARNARLEIVFVTGN